ncbi:co-chaperone DjlA [Thioalkalivibrio sp. XN8]|uniref:co-chaperone DjlA n=1 Tax=Thioalkalivibrio sp. XN8 TaxID=2712863 RepID=UPI0013EA9D7C|nr:co-chaperone DjlA [Thioalkalivibrio sp. XN8]NGP53330.1 co-chaperone DjlA [Thioalkalivibrio sp. XN8]
MRWAGKVAGAVIGSLAGPVGAAVGLFLGHQFDRGLGRSEKAPRLAPGAVSQLFFEATFSVMGHVAKADGRVSEAEIEAARGIMSRMRLNPGQVQAAIRLYTAGKAADFPLDATLARLGQALGGRKTLRRAFLEIQMEAALADGQLRPATRELLWRVAAALDLNRVEMAQVEALLRLGRGFGGQQAARPAPPSAADAYRVLGLTPEASDAEVKLAYRRLMNQHHPDKLRARGMPESMIPVAEEKTREIRKAWELVRAARGMR